MKKLLLWVLALGWVGGLYAQDTLAQAQRLEKYGMVSLAAAAYEKQAENPEAIKGLLRIALAQKQPQKVMELLQKAQGLGEDEAALYKELAQMQLGQGVTGLESINKTQLSPQQADWAYMAEGLQAYQRGNLDKAAALWKQISQTPDAFAYALALLPKDTDAPNSPLGKKARKALEKRIKRLRNDDWDIFKYYLWGVSQTQGPQTAAELMRGRTEKFDYGQPQLLMAYFLPSDSNERHDLIFDIIKSKKSTQNLRALALTMGARQQSISLVELQQALESVPEDQKTPLGLIVVQAWDSRGEYQQGINLIETLSVEGQPCDTHAIYYSTLAELTQKDSENAESLSKEISAYEKLIALECLSTQRRNEIMGHLADSYYKNNQFEQAAKTYLDNLEHAQPSERSRFYYQAVMAYIKDSNPQKAKEVLLNHNFGSYPQALLAYLMDARQRGEDVNELIKPFENTPMSDSERWPIDYLRIKQLASEDTAAALEMANRVLAKALPEEPWRINFELEQYDLLMKLGETQKATALMTQKLIEVEPHSGFIRRGIEEALRTRRFEEALAIINRLKDAQPQEEAQLLLLALDGMGERDKVEELSERLIDIIEGLPQQQQAQLTLKLARLWAKVGLLDEAVTLCENLLERDLSDEMRNQTEFLKCSLWELEGRAEAETGLLALSQRPQRNTQLAAYARLVGYYILNDQQDQAMKIFSEELMGIVSGEEDLPAQAATEVISAIVSIIPHVSEDEAARLSGWVQAHRTLPGTR